MSNSINIQTTTHRLKPRPPKLMHHLQLAAMVIRGPETDIVRQKDDRGPCGLIDQVLWRQLRAF